MRNRKIKIWYILHHGEDVSYSAAYNRVRTTVEGIKKYADIEFVKVSTRLSRYTGIEVINQIANFIMILKICIVFIKTRKNDIFVVYGESA